MSPGTHQTYQIKLVSDAFTILEQFYEADADLGVTDLSRRTKLTKNKVFRLLSTLTSLNYLEKNRLSGNYRLSLKVTKLTHNGGGRQLRKLNELHEILETMVKECDETVCFSVADDTGALVLDMVKGKQVLQVVHPVGSRFPSHCTAAGKIFMAAMTEDQLAAHLRKTRLSRFTPNTIVDQVHLAAHLQEVTAQGYALEREELELGVVNIGAPVRDITGRVIGAVTLPGPAHRYDEERLKKDLIPLLLKGAMDISASFGFV